MHNYSIQEFEEFLKAFSQQNTPIMHAAVSLVTSRALWNGQTEYIPDYMKQSLIRKVLRYVGETALQGSFGLDGLAVSCNFCTFANGYPESFGNDYQWSFFSNRVDAQIKVSVDKEFRYIWYQWLDKNSYPHSYTVKKWEGCNSLQTTDGKFDVIRHFEDPRTEL